MENNGVGENMIQQLTREQNAQIGGGVNVMSALITALGMSVGIYFDVTRKGYDPRSEYSRLNNDYALLRRHGRFGILGALFGFVASECLFG